jgi:uncharacterized membrane protein
MDKEKKQGYWRDSMVVFGRVSTWIVVPLLLAVFFGKKMDTYFGTGKILFIASVLAASVVTIFGIMKTITIYMKKSENKKDGSRTKSEEVTK